MINITNFTWYVACVPPQREKAAVDRLTDEGIACLLPVYHEWRYISRYRPEKKLMSYNLMPGYVLQGVKHRDQLVWKLPDLVSNIISSEGAPVAVSHDEVQTVVDWGLNYEPPAAHKYMRTHKEFKEGDWVMATAGAMIGRKFVVEKIMGSVARVQIELFKRGHDIELALDALEPI